MNYRKYAVFLGFVMAFGVFGGSGLVSAEAGELRAEAAESRAEAGEPSAEAGKPSAEADALSAEADAPSAEAASMQPGWNQSGEYWFWMDTDGRFRKGWLQTDGRFYYLEENGRMARGWREIDGEWYYFHEDGGMNQGEMILDNAVYECSKEGALLSARWLENTGGGAYNAGCYDEMTQSLFDELNEEKKTLYFKEHPDREEEYDGDMRRQYDRNAGLAMDMALNKAALHRLEAAITDGYMAERVPGEGTVSDYLATVPYRKNASCLEIYIRGCEDVDEAFSKVLEMTAGRYESGGDRTYSLEYYRSLGMGHREMDGRHYFIIILMR